MLFEPEKAFGHLPFIAIRRIDIRSINNVDLSIQRFFQRLRICQ